MLAGCSAAPPPPPPAAPVEDDLMSGWRLARFALEERQYDQAAELYARVLERAYARDDLGAIGDVGYELAVVRLRQLDASGAAEQARQTREELRRRGQEQFAELYLVEAVALYETAELAAPKPVADQAIALTPGPAKWWPGGRGSSKAGSPPTGTIRPGSCARSRRSASRRTRSCGPIGWS